MNVEETRSCLPESVKQSFDDIVSGRSLGASNHIKMISHMYAEIAKENDEATAKEYIEKVGQFFKKTRGESSYAIVNALEKVEKLIENSSEENYAVRVESAINTYFAQADQDVEKILLYTDRLLKDKNTVMIYDYSSTVEKAVAKCSHKLKVYIPESRVINGGFPFVEGIVNAGHEVCFIPDASMLTVLDEVDIAFIGAETFYSDGTAFNTVGSDILAELCMYHNVPYYVLTPMLKNDIRAMYGIYKPVLTKDLVDTMAKNWKNELKEKVNFTSIELVGVDPKWITGYVTEKGIIKATDLLYFLYQEGKDA